MIIKDFGKDNFNNLKFSNLDKFKELWSGMQQNNTGTGNQTQQSPESLMDDSYFGEIRSFMGKVMNSANTGENQQNRNSAAAVVAAVNRNHNISDILSKTSGSDNNANPLDVIQKLYPLLPFENAWKTMNAKMNGNDPVDKLNLGSDKNDNSSAANSSGSISNKKLENGSIDGGSEATIAEDEEEDEDEEDVDEEDIVDEGSNSDGSTAAGSGAESELDVESASPETISSIPKDDHMMIEEDDDDDVEDNNENDDLDNNFENKKRKKTLEIAAVEKFDLSKEEEEEDKGVITEEEDVDADEKERKEHSNSSKHDCITVNGDKKEKDLDNGHSEKLSNNLSNISNSSRKRSKKELTKTSDDLMV